MYLVFIQPTKTTTNSTNQISPTFKKLQEVLNLLSKNTTQMNKLKLNKIKNNEKNKNLGHPLQQRGVLSYKLSSTNLKYIKILIQRTTQHPQNASTNWRALIKFFGELSMFQLDTLR